jgi:seryl-tRNA synthetase
LMKLFNWMKNAVKPKTSLDNVSAQANAAAKQIGELMRAGKKDEAEAIKAKTGAWKEDIKT